MVTLSFPVNCFVICCHLLRSVQSARYTLIDWSGAVLGMRSTLLPACLSVSLYTQFDLPFCCKHAAILDLLRLSHCMWVGTHNLPRILRREQHCFR